MVLIGTSAGYITDTIDLHADASDCQDASNYLTKNFKGETIGFMIENIDQFKSGMHGEIKAFQKIVDTLVGGLKKNQSLKNCLMCAVRAVPNCLKTTATLKRRRRFCQFLTTRKNFKML